MQPVHPKLHLQDNIHENTLARSCEGHILWQSAARSHVGRVRHLNEDAYLELLEQHLWAVADGMGGHKRGDFASRTVVSELKKFVRSPSLGASIEAIEAHLHAANLACQGAFGGKRIGSTVAALFESNQHAFFIWAGDSRIYRLRDERLELMTCDHSLAQEKHARGELSEEELGSHASAHVLTRAIGVHKNLKLELRHDTIANGDRYLICSDGLYNGVDFARIETELKRGSPHEAMMKLIDCALDKGGRDNITVIVAEAQIHPDTH